MTPLRRLTIDEFLGALGARTPAPGGGAAASLAGALGAALGRMVVEYSVGRRSLEAHRADLERALAALTRARGVLMELAEEDAAAYERLSELMRLPEGEPRRRAEWAAAVALAVQVPRSVGAACCDLLRLFEHLASITNQRLRSDLAIAAILAEAGARAAWWNVAVNLPLLADEAERGRVRGEFERMLAEAGARRARVERACGDGSGG